MADRMVLSSLFERQWISRKLRISSGLLRVTSPSRLTNCFLQPGERLIVEAHKKRHQYGFLDIKIHGHFGFGPGPRSARILASPGRAALSTAASSAPVR